MRALRAAAGLARRSAYPWLEDPSLPLDGLSLSSIASPEQLWGPRTGHVSILRISTALRCIKILASSVAGCPLGVTNSQTHEPVPIKALQRYTSTGQTNYELFETMVAHVAAAGNSCTYKVRRPDGMIVDLVQIAPERIQIEIDTGRAAADVGLPWVKKFIIDGGADFLTDYEIMHVPGLSWDGVTGVSVIQNMRRMWEQANGFEQIGSDLLDHGLISPSVVTYPDDPKKVLDEERARILKARWRAMAGGAANAHELMILDQGAKLDRLTMSPADAQFLESRKFSRAEIAMIFGIPGWMINDQEKSTAWGTGMEQQFISYVVLTVSDYFHRIEQRIEREICDPATEDVRFDAEGLLRGDSKARAAFYASGIQHGWLVPNDIRPKENLPPVPWGEEPYRPFNEPANAKSASAADTTDEEGTDDPSADA